MNPENGPQISENFLDRDEPLDDGWWRSLEEADAREESERGRE